jgi:hypothetical protein
MMAEHGAEGGGFGIVTEGRNNAVRPSACRTVARWRCCASYVAAGWVTNIAHLTHRNRQTARGGCVTRDTPMCSRLAPVSRGKPTHVYLEKRPLYQVLSVRASHSSSCVSCFLIGPAVRSGAQPSGPGTQSKA